MEHNVESATGTRHCLQPNKEHRWLTGLTANGNQVLMGIDGSELISIRFSESGAMTGVEEHAGSTMQQLTQWASGVIAKPAAIRIGEFEVAARGIALRQFPAEYQEFLDSPWAFDVSERSHYAVLINEWRERERFVVVWNGEHWCCSDGLVHS